MKKCNVCKEEKNLSEFNSNKSNKDGLARECRVCKNKRDIQYRDKKREENSNKEIDYSGTIVCYVCKEEKSKTEYNKNKNTSTGLGYECKSCQTNRSNTYYHENKKEQSLKQKKYYERVREDKLKYQKEYQEKNKEKIKQYLKQYNLDNRERKTEVSREYNRKRKKEDPVYKFRINTRSMIYCSFKRSLTNNYTKSKKTEDILGCTMDGFIEYISSKFQEGMSLSNHGEWHIDHIIPLATAKTEEEVTALCHHTNLQPLWKSDNLSKGKKTI